MTARAAAFPRIQIRRCTGADEIRRHLDAVAALRIDVFRDWPYLYDGSIAYEREYLEAYVGSNDSVFVLAFEGDAVIGASTGLPLADDSAEFRAPFEARSLDAGKVFYLGESVLLPQYRGHGIGHAFFDHREAHARSLGRFDTTAFCAVDRDADDPRRPAQHRGNEAFWEKRGYARQPGMTMTLRWNEIGDSEAGHGEIEHALTFWTHALATEAGA
ncbi:MAG: GNAT family N-acetyltransferase [Pseudomonadota bacterium]